MPWFASARPLSLHDCAARGDVGGVSRALSCGADASALSAPSLETALHAASLAAAPDCVALLLSAGCPVDAASSRGHTALHAACCLQSRNACEVVRLLLRGGARTEVRTKKEHRTPLHNAAEYGLPDQVAALLDEGADACAATRSGTTPLALAQARGDPPSRHIVALLSAAAAAADAELTPSTHARGFGCCVVCLGAPCTTGLLHGDSAHAVVCAACARPLIGKPCPLCRATVERTIVIYI